jgi:hypothetical protein
MGIYLETALESMSIILIFMALKPILGVTSQFSYDSLGLHSNQRCV